MEIPLPAPSGAPVQHTLTFNSTTESTINIINLYSSQAQVTRSYQARVLPGKTKVTITHLPNVVDHSSVRVQGRGPAIIKGVSAFKAGRSAVIEGNLSSDLLDTLADKRQRIVNAKERADKARLVIGRYMDGITIEHLDISKLGEAMDVYDETDGKWEEKIWSLEDQLRDVDRNIRNEKDKLSQGEIPVKLRTRVVLDLHAAVETELDIVLTYAVSNAQWEAEYDLRVDMQNQTQPVKLTYKARISQDTAEDWTNVPITLETARPASGIDMPSLYTWNIHYHEPPAVSASGKGRTRQTARMATGGKAARRMLIPRDENDLSFQASDVTSTGHVNATFRVPGLSTIPADGEEHGVVIAELDDLDAIVGWVCIPKFGTSVHLEARVTNTSAYTLIEGPSSIYVDHSFISRSEIPDASPKEVLLCALGVDPSIRVTYHPRTAHVSEAGFYNKSKKHSFSQRITVHNSKSVEVKGVKVRDNIPVSEDSNLIVNLITPPLTSPDSNGTTVSSVKLGHDIVARWTVPDGVVSARDDIDGPYNFVPGQDGMLEWVCSIPAHGKINLVLEWEILSNSKSDIFGIFGQ